MGYTKNLAKMSVPGAYDSSATSIVLSAGHGSKLPATTPYFLTWWNTTLFGDPADDPNAEIVEVTSRTTDTLTVLRGRQGTAASNKNTPGGNYKMVLAVTAYDLGNLSAMSASSKELWVDAANGDDASAVRGHPHRPFATIQAAFAVIASGDTLRIRGGTYTVNPTATGPNDLATDLVAPLVLNGKTDINIIGEGFPVLSYAGAGDILLIHDCKRISFEGLDFLGNGPNTTVSPITFGGIWATVHIHNSTPACEDLYFHNCRFRNYTDHAIAHCFGPRATKRVRVTNCYFTKGGHFPTPSGPVDGAGVVCIGSDAIVSNCTFYDTLRGFEIEGAGPQRNITVSNCVFDKIWDIGFMTFCTSGTALDIQGVTVTGCVFRHVSAVNAPSTMSGQGLALLLNGGLDYTISNNIFSGYTDGGLTATLHNIGCYAGELYADLWGVTISNNVIIGGANGILVFQFAGATKTVRQVSITDNIIYFAAGDGIQIRATNFMISGNHITDCGDYGIDLKNDGGGGANSMTPTYGANSNAIRIFDNISMNMRFTGQTYGIRLQNQFQGIVCYDNDCRNNDTGGILNETSGAGAAILRDNNT